MDKRGLLDLIISLLPGLRSAERITLLQNFNEEGELFVQSKRDIEVILKREIKEFWDISNIRDKAGRIDTICPMRSIKWVSFNSVEYPPLLREIYDPPSVIFYRGVLPNPEKSLLGMVGTRRPSPEASQQAYKIAYEIGREGVSVVSGLALGIDAMSHRGNLASGVRGFAVLGSGIDQVYPSSNKPLAKKILDSGGALISEYPPGVHPDKWTFPARNRIIAALSRSLLVVEAPQKSGALITANFALEQGKDLWTASCGTKKNAFFDRRGTEGLAEDGAQIISCAKDIIEKWGIDIAPNVQSDAVSDDQTCRRALVSSMADFLEIEV